MHVAETGSGRPVLLLHGAGVSGWMWQPTLDRLGPSHRAIVPDLPGFGRSAAETYPTRAEVVDRLAAITVERAPRGVVVAGFSLGAQLAIQLASSYPALVRGAVVVSGETHPAAFRRTTLALLALAAPLARRERFARLQARQLAVPPELLDDYLRDSATVGRATLLASVGENLAFELPSGWASWRGPATVLVGAGERAMMRRSASLTAAARGLTPRVIAGSGHDLPFTRPELVADAIRSCVLASDDSTSS